MRVVVYGAGAVGGVVGGRLFDAGHDVTLIARGAHLDAIRRDGLRVVAPDRAFVVPVPAVGHPAELDLTADTVVLLGMKTQDTAAALDALVAAGPPNLAIGCLQNGVENERLALRRFARVYGITVMLPAGHFDPGVVIAYSAPTPGMLDVGRYPGGVDTVAEELTAVFASAGFDSVARPDIMAWKHRKLLVNLSNAIEALCGSRQGTDDLTAAAMAEGEACLRAAGIAFKTGAEDRERRADFLQVQPIEGYRTPGSSSWQSLVRGTGTIEADHLNGEIVLLGRLHGVPTPVNDVLQRQAADAARHHRPPGSITVEDLRALIGG